MLAEKQTLTKDEDEAITSALALLRKKFDNVQIFVNSVRKDGEESKTEFVARGDGNLFARCAQVRRWTTMRDEEDRRAARDDEA